MPSEDYAYLPGKIVGYTHNGTMPVFAQWNYRIACHSLQEDLPLKHLVLVDDITRRMSDMQTAKVLSCLIKMSFICPLAILCIYLILNALLNIVLRYNSLGNTLLSVIK